MYAILRFDKLKTSADVKTAASHHLRTIPTPNADPNRTAQNFILFGSKSDTPDSIAAEAAAIPSRRKDAVRGIGFVMTASPEFWKTATEEQKTDWVNSSTQWLDDEFGTKRVIFANLQMDETSPHIQGIILPIDESGKLNARKVFGREALTRYQTEYAKSVQHLGLNRGEPRSAAKHTTIKEFYGALHSEPPKVAVPPVPPLPGKMDRMSDEKLEAWGKSVRDSGIRAMLPAYEQEAKAAKVGRLIQKQQAQERQSAAKKIEAAKENSETWKERFYEQKERADKMADISFDEVINELGLEQDPKDREKYKDDAGRKYSITKDGYWKCWSDDSKGAGVVSFIQQVKGCSKGQAFGWLRTQFSDSRVAASSPKVRDAIAQERAEVEKAPKTPFIPPAHHDVSWRVVRSYLTNDRGIDGSIVDDLYNKRRLLASRVQLEDSQGRELPPLHNAVFLQTAPDGTPTGASVRGVTKDFKGEAKGSRKDSGAFWIGNNENPKYIMVVEGAIDAMALYQKKEKSSDFLIVSTAGAGQGAISFINQHPSAKVFACQDNDNDGNEQAKRLAEALPDRNIERIAPTGKDWAEEYDTRAPSHLSAAIQSRNTMTKGHDGFSR